MEGHSWLVRRAETRLGAQLGNLVYIASARRIRWSWLAPCLVIGFTYGVLGELFGAPRSNHTPDLFANIPLFILVSVLTGFLLWGLTFIWSFRKLLVFDGRLVTMVARAATTQVFPWHQINAGSIHTVTTPDGPARPCCWRHRS